MPELSKEFKTRIKRMLRSLNSFRSWQSIFFNLTYACPLACKYCYIDPELKGMTLEEVEYVMEQINQDKGNYSRTITFFGGEPALQMDIIEKIVPKYYNETIPGTNERRYRFGIITGFSVNQERLMKLYEQYPFEIVVSYDNPNDGNRIDHNGVPFNALAELKKYTHLDLGRYVYIKNTLSGNEKNFLSDIKELDEFHKQTGVSYCWSHNKTPFKIPDDNYRNFKSQYSSVIDYILTGLEENPNRFIPKIVATEYLQCVTGTVEQNHGGCGLMTEIFISHEGRIYPCSISNSKLPYFDLTDGDATEEIECAERQCIHNPTCDSCDIRYFCNGGCIVDRSVNFGDYGKPNPNWCDYIHAIESAVADAANKHKDTETYLRNELIKWRIGHYKACLSPTDNRNIVGGVIDVNLST